MTRLGKIKLVLELLWNALLLLLFPFSQSLRLKFLLVCLFINLLCGRYRHKALLIWDEVRYLVQAWLGIFFVDLLFLPFPPIAWVQVGWLVLYVVSSFLGVLLINRYAHLVFWKFVRQKVLIVGTGAAAEEVYDVCKHNRFSLLEVRGFVQYRKGDEDVIPESVRAKIPVYPLSSLESVIDQKKIDTVLVAVSGIGQKEMRRLLSRVSRKVDNVRYIPLLEEQINFSSKIEDFDGQLLISTSTGKMTGMEKVFKRAVDILAAIPGMLILGPLTVYVWCINKKYGNEGPLFFKQKRIGLHGKEFEIYKFRSMVVNADQILEELMEKDPAIREEYTKNKKLEHDPRIIPAWDRLRRKSIDEFPQFINVLKGDMSLIGPRPYLPREKADMGEIYEEVIQSKPGITGMWQTHGRSAVDFERRLELDSYYYHNWSTWLDLTLLVRTLKELISKEDNNAA